MSRARFSLSLLFLILSTVAAIEETATSGGLFSFLPKFSLPGAACVGKTDARAGQCSADCDKVGGFEDGECALNTGHCCVTPYKCGETVITNNSFVGNPQFPAALNENQQCSVTIRKLVNVQAIRLELIRFELNPPLIGSGKCEADKFSIEEDASLVKLPNLCGFNSGQHLMVPVASTSDHIRLNFITSGPGNRKWLLRVVQLEAPLPLMPATNLLPPFSGCRQYFTGLSGQVMSFDFDAAPNSMGGGKGIIDGLKYSMCFRKEAGYCGIRFEPLYFELTPRTSRSKRCSGQPGEVGCVAIPMALYLRLAATDPELAAWGRNATPSSLVNVTASRPLLQGQSMALANYSFPLPQQDATEPEDDSQPGQAIAGPTARPCSGQDSLSFPPSAQSQGPSVFCGRDFNGGKAFTVDSEPTVLFFESGSRHGLGFFLKYTYVAC